MKPKIAAVNSNKGDRKSKPTILADDKYFGHFALAALIIIGGPEEINAGRHFFTI